MTPREQYIQEKNNGVVNLEKAFEVFNKFSQNPIPLHIFVQTFQMWFQFSGGQIENYWKYWDNHFEIVTLTDNKTFNKFY